MNDEMEVPRSLREVVQASYDKLGRAYYGRALHILHNMALERTGWRGFFRRWIISHEPLRNDAANLLREIGYREMIEEGQRLVGSPPSDQKEG